MYILIILIIFLFFLKCKESYKNQPQLNIYNQPLEQCRNNINDNGSWDSYGKCSEVGGGVHQICIKNISDNTKNFSLKTGQSNWSDKREGNNHCVCLGAWSLYNAINKDNSNNNKILKCDAIPKISLSSGYVSKFSEGWNKWNGLELSDQIVDGVESLFKNCYNPDDKKSKALKENYCNFAKNEESLKNTDLYRLYC